MSRITKAPDERRNEIIDVAEELFLTNGFEETSVSDIVGKIGVAQGLFYYYFKSKDEVFDAVAERLIDLLLIDLEVISQDNTSNSPAKIQSFFSTLYSLINNKKVIVNRFHQNSYEAMHQRLTAKLVEKLTPVFAIIIREGMNEGLFLLEEPDETAEILLHGLEYYLNRLMKANLGTTELGKKMRSATSVLERALGAAKGSLQFKGDNNE